MRLRIGPGIFLNRRKTLNSTSQRACVSIVILPRKMQQNERRTDNEKTKLMKYAGNV